MAYVVRTKDNPGDVGRAADQQQSVDNESALYAAVLGNGPVSTGGTVRQFVKKTGMADNVATEVFTITTTNEAGNTDGGVYGVEIQGIACHGIVNSLDTSVIHIRAQFARAMAGAGTGVNSAVIESSETAVAASTAGTKTITTVTFTLVETSEYILSVLVTIDCAGTTVTTADFCGMISLTYAGFTTPPVITSAG